MDQCGKVTCSQTRLEDTKVQSSHRSEASSVQREELIPPGRVCSMRDAALSHSWQELIGNGTASQQRKNILRNYSDYNKRQGFSSLNFCTKHSSRYRK